jgi:hypothetical protein
MAWHRPRFRPIHLIALVAVLAVEFAILPARASIGVAGLTVFCAVLASVSGPLTRIEWVVIVAIHALLILLLLPAVKGSHGRRPRPTPSTTTGPESGMI